MRQTGHFVSTGDAKLARSAALRELVSDEQLKVLYRSDRPVKWLSADITYDRTPGLRRCLLDELDVEEVPPEGFARRFDEDFVKEQTDEWMIRLYRFLDDQKALWTASRHGAAKEQAVHSVGGGLARCAFPSADGRAESVLPLGNTDRFTDR